MRNQKSEMRNDPRLYWVDLLRGVFIVLMIGYHFAFDLNYLSLFKIDVFSGGWLFFGRIIQFGFLGLVGLSLFLSYRHSEYRVFLRRQALRALKVFGAALLVSAGTWFVAPDAFIRFGILHLISACILLGALITPSIPLTVASLFLSLALGFAFSGIETPFSLLIPLGLAPADFYTFDYFPLFPWFSVVLAGILLARFLDFHSWIKNPQWLGRLLPLETIGRHSLLIYLIHQPILLAGLWLFVRFR